MSRYKGRANLKVIKSKLLCTSDMLVPEGGFGTINAMHDWHDATAFPPCLGKDGAKMAATTFAGASLTRNLLKRSRVNLTNCAQHE